MLKIYGASQAEAKIVKKTYKSVLKTLRQKDIFCTEVCFVSDDEIKELNLKFRNADKVTDVLSFPSLEVKELPVSRSDFANEETEKGKIVLGSLAVCLSKAIEQAYEFGHSTLREIAYLSAHGFLHLLGFDHGDDETNGEIFDLAESALNRIGLKRIVCNK